MMNTFLNWLLKTGTKQNSFALFSGFLVALSFDFNFDDSLKFVAPLLTIVGLTGMMCLFDTGSVKRPFVFGYAFGLGLFGYGLDWIYVSMYFFGGSNLWFSIAANIALVAFISLYWGATLWFTSWLSKQCLFKPKSEKSSSYTLYLFAICVGFFEWLRSVLFIGFPWLSLGYSFVDTPFASWAKLTGVFGVSVFVVLTLAIVINLLKKKCKRVMMVWSLLLVSTLIFTLVRETTRPSAKPLNVALIQGNINVITKFDPKHRDDSLHQYFELTDDAFDPKIDLVVWPETAIPYYYDDARPWLEAMFQIQMIGSFDFITGIPEGSYSSDKIYNAIMLQSEDAAPQAFYLKSHLLPFGEYLPFRSVFAFFEDFVDIPMSDFSRGPTEQPLFLVRDVKIAPSICFEAVFGDDVRLSANSAELMLNLSNDGWFGKSKAQLQHLNVQRMRAIENAKPIIRSTNDGITAIVDHKGRVIYSIPQYQPGVLVGKVTPYSGMTLYSRCGDWSLLGLLAIMTGLCAFFARKRNANLTIQTKQKK